MISTLLNDLKAREINRFGLWVLLILLTISILLFPTTLNFEYSKMQSIHIFKNLPLFSILFYSWGSVLFLLIISQRDTEDMNWEQLALVFIFNIIFLSFWVINTPQGTRDGFNVIIHTTYLQNEGTIHLENPNFNYFNFPGIHILVVFISQVSGLTILSTRTFYLIMITFMFSAILYILFTNILKNSFFSTLAVITFIEGNWMFSRLFHIHPAQLGLLFFTTFLVLMNNHDQRLFRTRQEAFIAIILLISNTTTHFVTSFLFPFILLGIYVVQQTGKDKIVNLSTIIIFAVIPLTWNFTYASRHLNILLLYIPIFFKTTSFMNLFSNIFIIAEANIGFTIPLWVNITRLFWIFLIYGVGVILAIRSLVKVKNLTSMEKKGIGSLMGVIILVIILTLLSTGGYQFYRFLIFSPFFLIPIIFRFSFSINNQMKKHIITLLITFLIVFSLPSFLSNNSLISTKKIYQQEISIGEFVNQSKTVDTEKELTVFQSGSQKKTFLLSVPNNVTFRIERAYYTGVQSTSDLNQTLNEMASDFLEHSPEDEDKSIFVISSRLMIFHQHTLGIYPTDPIWIHLSNRLNDRNKIYINDQAQIYIP